MKKFVWDTSALLNVKESDSHGYSPANSLYKDFNDGWLPGPYKNIFPAIAAFEINASVSRKHREGKNILREFYVMGEHSVLYPIDEELIRKSAPISVMPGFDKLRGADLIFACIAKIEDAYLVTLDNHFEIVANDIRIINLNESKQSALYRKIFEPAESQP